jgi:hypothetical protein
VTKSLLAIGADRSAAIATEADSTAMIARAIVPNAIAATAPMANVPQTALTANAHEARSTPVLR